jgi:SPP1 gp7 family putative phage head morphogenesis protein
MVKQIELKPIKPETDIVELLEKAVIQALREQFYKPILEEIGAGRSKILKNALDDVISAILAGKIIFDRGTFRGKFTSSISKELKSHGARWDKVSGSWKIHYSKLPIEIKNAIDQSRYRMEQKIKAIDKKIAAIIPDELLKHVRLEHLFDRQIWDLDNKFRDSMAKVTIQPKFTEEQRKKIAAEYTNNMKLDIKKWMDEEIVSLRKKVDKHVLTGLRYENLVPMIQKSYGVSVSKARFIARQETNLLTTKFREIRYTDAGAKKYIWRTVVGTTAHPVRPQHQKLNGTIQSWDSPPIVSEPDQPIRRAHAGADFNCRCIAIPIVSFDKDGDKK